MLSLNSNNFCWKVTSNICKYDITYTIKWTAFVLCNKISDLCINYCEISLNSSQCNVKEQLIIEEMILKSWLVSRVNFLIDAFVKESNTTNLGLIAKLTRLNLVTTFNGMKMRIRYEITHWNPWLLRYGQWLINEYISATLHKCYKKEKKMNSYSVPLTLICKIVTVSF